jgi:lipopolysaccharide biosynthesis glycosyltransferase
LQFMILTFDFSERTQTKVM